MKKKELLYDVLFDILGSFLYATGIYCFFESADIAPGGVSGIAIMVKHLSGFPVGLFSVIINIPLLIVASRKISGRFVLKSVKSLLIGSFIIDAIVTPFFPLYIGDRMLSSVFGGIFTGIGMAAIFMRGSSTAGTDILSILTEERFPHIQIGTAMLLIDFVIITVSALVFKNIESALFGLVAIFCQTRVIDIAVYGINKGRQILIISDENEKIAKTITTTLKRGATFLDAKGAYENKKRTVLLCVVRRSEYYIVKNIVHTLDPRAFIITCEATQVLGEGFEPIVKKR